MCSYFAYLTVSVSLVNSLCLKQIITPLFSCLQEIIIRKVNCGNKSYGIVAQLQVYQRVTYFFSGEKNTFHKRNILSQILINLLFCRISVLPDDPNVVWNENVIFNLVINYVETLHFDAVRNFHLCWIVNITNVNLFFHLLSAFSGCYIRQRWCQWPSKPQSCVLWTCSCHR